MTRRLLDHDRETGLRTFHEFDAASGETRLRYEQDVEAHLDRNKAMQAETPGTPMGDFCLVASIPVSIQLKWMVEKGVDVLNPDHKQKVAKLLDDPEWRHLKVRNIILGRV